MVSRRRISKATMRSRGARPCCVRSVTNFDRSRRARSRLAGEHQHPRGIGLRVLSRPVPHRPKPAPVPQTRLGRLARIGFAAAEMAVGGAVEGLRGLARSDSGLTGSSLFSARNAQRLAARLARLRGAAMKLGPNVFPPTDRWLPPPLGQAPAV